MIAHTLEIGRKAFNDPLRNLSSAPPVYRPTGDTQEINRKPVSGGVPKVYNPQPVRSSAPPVYRPTRGTQEINRKPVSGGVPKVYNPQPVRSSALPVYRPTRGTQEINRKPVSGGVPKVYNPQPVRSFAPPVYHPGREAVSVGAQRAFAAPTARRDSPMLFGTRLQDPVESHSGAKVKEVYSGHSSRVILAALAGLSVSSKRFPIIQACCTSVIQAVLNSCGNNTTDTQLVTVKFLSQQILYFTPATGHTITDLKNAIRQHPTHSGKGLRILLNAIPVGDTVALQNTTYWCVYALPSSDDATLPQNDDDEHSDSDTDTNSSLDTQYPNSGRDEEFSEGEFGEVINQNGTNESHMIHE